VIDHRGPLRKTLQADEEGRITSPQPYDTVQQARLRRFAERTEDGWRLSGASVRKAVVAGFKTPLLSFWLEQMLAKPLPLLLEYALVAWAEKAPPVELGGAVLLHVADEDLFAALAESERLRPLLSGSPGRGWLAVRPDAVPAVSALLTELGFKATPELTFGEITLDEDDGF
jgi:hypothetical protein